MKKRMSKRRTTTQKGTGSGDRSRWLMRTALAASAVMSFRLGAEAYAQDHTVDLLDQAPPQQIGRFDLMPGLEEIALLAFLDDEALAKVVPPNPQRREKDDAAATEPPRRFDIPPGLLGVALDSFEETTGVDVETAEGDLRSLGSPGVSGVFTDEQALAALLTGTGASYRFTQPGQVVVELHAISETLDVTGTLQPSSPKYTEPLRDVPQTITVIPESLLQEQGATTLRDVLRNVTGISIQAGEGGVPAGDNLSIRGFNARTDLFIDGVRDVGGYSRDPFNLEQVEVVKGPASAFSGRGSTGGAVNLVSKTPHLDTQRQVSFGAGTDDFGRATLDLNQPLTGIEGAALRLNAMWTEGNVPGREVVASERFGVAPSLAFGIGTPTRATVSYFHLEQDNVPDYGIPWVPATNVPLADFANQPAPVDFDNFYGLSERDYEDTLTQVGTAEIEHDFNDTWTLRNLVRYGETDRDSIITAPRFQSNDSTDIRRTDWKSRDQVDTILANQLDLSGHFETGKVLHRLVTGVEFGHETSVNYARVETGQETGVTDLFNPDPSDPYTGSIERTGDKTDANADSLGVYAFDTLELSPKWQVTAGLRWDRFDLEFDSPTLDAERVDETVSWRTGAVYKPAPNGSVYLGLGTSFNPSTEGLALATNTVNLAPEKSRSYEVGTKWDLLGSRLGLSFALFETRKTNARTPGLNPGDPPLVLDGEERIRGFEVGVSGHLSDRWGSWLSYTYLDSEVVASNDPVLLGNAFGNTPEHSFSLWTTYELRSNFELGAGAQFVGDRFNSNNSTRIAPSYWLFDAMASYEVNQLFTLRLNLNNLTDEDYIDRIGGGHFIPGQGRSASLTTSLAF